MDPLREAFGRLTRDLSRISARVRDIETNNARGIYPRTVVARYSSTLVQAVPHATIVTVDFNLGLIDSHGRVTTGSGWRFQAPMTGYYTISCILRLTPGIWTEAATAVMWAAVNGAAVDRLDIVDNHASTSSVYTTLNGTDTIYVEKDSNISIALQQTQGTTLTLNGTAAHNRVSIIYSGA